MTGAEILLKTAVNAGVEICFTNPGTTELPLVTAFDTVPGIRPILGLFEGCCTGAADGYGRMTNKPAMTLLHLGPGLGNGIAKEVWRPPPEKKSKFVPTVAIIF